MAQINILDHQTIDKIAAGEVVERPASVVKELVENAIDAGADAVTVEIREGGIRLIRVTDNGSGIEKTQVHNAFLRHATSKITSADDLTDLVSLGFRGEALASIAAVSMVEITKTPEELTGLRYVIEGGQEMESEEVGAPEGTTVLVRNLFYNVPPRRKFLKQPQTEGSYVAELMEHLALSRPGNLPRTDSPARPRRRHHHRRPAGEARDQPRQQELRDLFCQRQIRQEQSHRQRGGGRLPGIPDAA